MTVLFRSFLALRRNILLTLCLVSALMFGVFPVQAQLNFSRIASMSVGNTPALALPGDFNGDGKMDIATVNIGVNSGQSVSIRYNDGVGNFSGTTTIPVQYAAGKATVADFNNDGRADIAVIGARDTVILGQNSQYTVISVCLSQVNGTFQQVIVPLPAANSPNPNARAVASASTQPTNTEYGICAADFDGNGAIDIAANMPTASGFVIALNSGGAVFNRFTSFATPIYMGIVSAADFNNDGKQDFCFVNYSQPFPTPLTAYVVLNNGLVNNVLSFTVKNEVPLQGYSLYGGVSTADFNGDGKTDIAVSTMLSTGQGHVAVRFGDGTGNLSGTMNIPVSPAVGYPGYTQFGAPCAADFNFDGKIDIAVPKSIGSVSIFRNNGLGDFASAVEIPVGGAPSFVSSADFNGDTEVDFAVSQAPYGVVPSVEIYANQTPRLDFAVSGTIQNNVNASLALSGTATSSTTASVAGAYSFSGLANGTYTITPTLTGYVFVPSSTSVTISGTSLSGINFQTFAAAPPAPATVLTFSSVGASSAALTWNPPVGGAQNYIVVVRAGGTPSYTPQNGTSPTGVNSNFTLASPLADGSRIVYDGSGTSVSLTGLSPQTSYTVVVFPSNGSGAMRSYQINAPLTGMQSTSALPQLQITPASLDFGSVTVGTVSTGSLTISGTSLLAAVNVTAANPSLSLSLTNTPFTTQAVLSLTPTNGVLGATQIFVRFSPSVIGGYASTLTVSSLNATSAVVTVNGAGIQSQNQYSIFGSIGIASGVVTLGGAATQSTSASSVGAYSFSTLANGVYTVTPTLTGYVFVPSSTSVTISGASAYGVNFQPFAVPPSAAATTLVFSLVNASSATIAWNPPVGGAQSYIVVVRPNGTPSYSPANGTTPTGVNSDITLANALADGSRIVYDGSGTSLLLTGLSPQTNYTVVVFPSNGAGAVRSYQTVSPLTSSFVTLPPSRITLTPSALDFGSVTLGTVSTASFSVNGDGLTEALVLTSSGASFSLSLTGSPFTTQASLSLVPVSNTILPTTVFVRFTPSVTGASAGAILASGASTATLTLNGTGTAPIPPPVLKAAFAGVRTPIDVTDLQAFTVTFRNAANALVDYPGAVDFRGGTPLGASTGTLTLTRLSLGTYQASSVFTGTGSYTLSLVGVTSTSGTRTFTVQASVNNPAPTLSSIAPATTTATTNTWTLTLNGLNFLPESRVIVDGVTLDQQNVSFVSGALLKAQVVQPLAGIYSVVVENPTPGGGASLPRTLTVNNPVPLLAAIAPVSVEAGQDAVLTLYGGYFTTATIVRFQNGAVTTTLAVLSLLSPTMATVTIPGSLITISGSYPIRMYTPVLGGGVSSVKALVVQSTSAVRCEFENVDISINAGRNLPTFTIRFYDNAGNPADYDGDVMFSNATSATVAGYRSSTGTITLTRLRTGVYQATATPFTTTGNYTMTVNGVSITTGTRTFAVNELQAVSIVFSDVATSILVTQNLPSFIVRFYDRYGNLSENNIPTTIRFAGASTGTLSLVRTGFATFVVSATAFEFNGIYRLFANGLTGEVRFEVLTPAVVLQSPAVYDRPYQYSLIFEGNSAFGNSVCIGASQIKSIQVDYVNFGSSALRIRSINSDYRISATGDANSFTLATTLTVTASTGTLKFFVQFIPTTVGAGQSQISLSSDGVGPLAYLGVSGSGIQPAFTALPSTIAFPPSAFKEQGTRAQTYTLNFPCQSCTNITITAPPGFFVRSTLAGCVAYSSSCTVNTMPTVVEVMLNPGVPGAFSGFVSNQCGSLDQPVAVNGTIFADCEDKLVDTISVLVLYTPGVPDRLAQQSRFANNVRDYLKELNRLSPNVFRNSRVSNLSVVIANPEGEQITFEEIGITDPQEQNDTNLDAIYLGVQRTGNNPASRIAQLRNRYRADIVCAMGWGSTSAAGLTGDTLAGIGRDRGYMYFGADTPPDSYVFLHEIGHLCLGNHEPGACTGSNAIYPDGQGFFDGSYTCVNGRSFGTGVGTIMFHGYRKGDNSNMYRIPYWSNPTIIYNDLERDRTFALGVPARQNMSRVVGVSGQHVANFYPNASNVRILGADVLRAGERSTYTANPCSGGPYTFEWYVERLRSFSQGPFRGNSHTFTMPTGIAGATVRLVGRDARGETFEQKLFVEATNFGSTLPIPMLAQDVIKGVSSLNSTSLNSSSQTGTEEWRNNPYPTISESPNLFALEQNQPNPFTEETEIAYSLDKDEYVSLTLHDALGRVVAVIDEARHRAGRYAFVVKSEGLPSGVYRFRLRVGGRIEVKTCVIMK